MQLSKIKVCLVEPCEASRFFDFTTRNGLDDSRLYWQQSLDAPHKDLFIASMARQDTGFCFLNRAPKYQAFRHQNMFEIQDLYVAVDYRRQGIGSALMEHCESLARKAGGEKIGVGVGLSAGFGPAQILYAQRGFVPDGRGLTYDRRGVKPGEFIPVDDHLCLMLEKKL